MPIAVILKPIFSKWKYPPIPVSELYMKKLTALLLSVLCSSAWADSETPISHERIESVISQSRLVSCKDGECWDYFTGVTVASDEIEPTYTGQVILFESDEFTNEELEQATPYVIQHFKEMDQRIWGNPPP